MIKVALAGGVKSSKRTLEQLIQNNFEIVGVLGYEPKDNASVSGYAKLDSLCHSAEIPYVGFRKINDQAIEATLRDWAPEVFFVVGLSQLIGATLLQLPALGCVGFHPTRLPLGRGRAPIAWTILDQCPAAATFFLMGEGADDGPIFVQEPFETSDNDTASDVEERLLQAMDRGLANWLPQLAAGDWDPKPQDETGATWYGRRTPEDGLINWHSDAQKIDRLVRAASQPHPGAYSFYGERKIIVWQTRLETEMPIKGVVGRILQISENGAALVQAGEGLIWLEKYEIEDAAGCGGHSELRVGARLGYDSDQEIYDIKRRLLELEKGLQP